MANGGIFGAKGFFGRSTIPKGLENSAQVSTPEGKAGRLTYSRQVENPATRAPRKIPQSAIRNPQFPLFLQFFHGLRC